MPLPWHEHRTLLNGFRGMWLLGGAESPPGPHCQHCQVLLTTTGTPAGAPVGLVPLAPSPLLYPLEPAEEFPCPGGTLGERVAVTCTTSNWGC